MSTPDNNKTDSAETLSNGIQRIGYEMFVKAIDELENKSLVSIATGAREEVIEKAPHILHIFHTAAEEWPSFASELQILGTKISTGSTQDYGSIRLPPNRTIANLIKHLFALHLAPSALAELLFNLAETFSDLAISAREELDKFYNNEPGVIAAYLTFSSISNLRTHEFLSNLTIDNRKPNMTNSGDYVASLFASLLCDRPDIAKSINSKVSNSLTCQIIENRYVELGGEQHTLETIGQSCIDKSVDKTSELPLNRIRTAIDKAFEETSNLLIRHQRQETGLLQYRNRLEELGKTVSLDTSIDKDGQETVTLESTIPVGQDMDMALDAYYSAVSRLPADMQPVFRRIIEKNESPKQAALNLGFNWTAALERRLERMKNKIYKEML